MPNKVVPYYQARAIGERLKVYEGVNKLHNEIEWELCQTVIRVRNECARICAEMREDLDDDDTPAEVLGVLEGQMKQVFARFTEDTINRIGGDRL